MGILLKKVNSLPVRTWRRLGVNGETLDIELPEASPFGAARPALPQGVTRAHESVLVCAEFKSAVAEELATYTRVHANAGLGIRVAKGVTAAEPICMRYELDAERPALVDNNVIFAEAHSEVTVVLVYDGADDSECFHSGLTRVIAENCAMVRVIQLQTLGKNTRHFSDFSAVIANGARVELVRVELGGRDLYVGSHMKLEGDKSEARTDTFYYGDGNRKLDFNYIARHLGQSTHCEMETSGALFDSCEKNFRGTIDFVTGAVGAKGAESENVLTFSENARNRSAPLILCGEETVEGSHAASIGKIDASKLYYLRSRGISELEAKRMMVAAQMETVIKNVPLEEERERLRDALGMRIK